MMRTLIRKIVVVIASLTLVLAFLDSGSHELYGILLQMLHKLSLVLQLRAQVPHIELHLIVVADLFPFLLEIRFTFKDIFLLREVRGKYAVAG